MNEILLSVLLLTLCLHIVNSANSTNITVDHLTETSTNEINCTANHGYQCIDCFNVATCVWNELSNTYDVYKSMCPNDMTCSNGECTDRHEPQCDINITHPEFECRTPGMYPDPFDCKKYYYCIPVLYTIPGIESHDNSIGSTISSNKMLIKYSAECDCNYSYNAYTKSCLTKLTNSYDCPWPPVVPFCYNEGQSEVLWQNRGIYYICLKNYLTGKLYPYLYGCENDKLYNSRTHLCESEPHQWGA